MSQRSDSAIALQYLAAQVDTLAFTLDLAAVLLGNERPHLAALLREKADAARLVVLLHKDEPVAAALGSVCPGCFDLAIPRYDRGPDQCVHWHADDAVQPLAREDHVELAAKVAFDN